MALLAGTNYDPAGAVSASTASLLPMTAFDTTNLRLTFQAPANGKVLVRIRCTQLGATTFPVFLLGILEGASVVARQSTIGCIPGTSLATNNVTQEALFTVTGLVAGSSHTYDAAYDVEVTVAATNIKYGGPNDGTGGDAWGGFQFEIWEAPALLAGILYDPSVAVAKSTASLIAMTALDTTNLRNTFIAPSSGSVMVRLRGVCSTSATPFAQVLLGVLDGSTVRCRTSPIGGLHQTSVSSSQMTMEGQAVVTGLTPGTTYNWDAAYAVQVAVASTNLKYGGPNNSTTNDAWGGFLFEVWTI